MTASAEWKDFSKLVEAVMRVERSLMEKKIECDSSKSGRVVHSSGVTPGQSGRRFVPGVFKGGNFKTKLSGQTTFKTSTSGGTRG